MSKQYLITAEILGVKKYVTELDAGPNGKKIVSGYSLVDHEGKRFDSATAALDAIDRIHNLQGRNFKVEPYTPKHPTTRRLLHDQPPVISGKGKLF